MQAERPGGQPPGTLVFLKMTPSQLGPKGLWRPLGRQACGSWDTTGRAGWAGQEALPPAPNSSKGFKRMEGL